MSYKLVNLWQTQEERRGKYHLLRSLGVNVSHAIAMRDWRLTKIERLFHLTDAPCGKQPSAQAYLDGLPIALHRADHPFDNRW